MHKLGALALLLSLCLIACSSIEADWQTASSTNTIAAYQDFLKLHPNGDHANEARTRIHALEDDQAWMTALNADSQQSFEQYLSAEPKGAHVQDAHDKITALERAAAWKTAQADGSVQALQGFLQKYPQGPEADAARAQLETLTHGYRVQLGAFRSKRTAERDRARLKARYVVLLHDVVLIGPTPPDKLTRIDSAPMSEGDAKAACEKLKREHQACKVVKS